MTSSRNRRSVGSHQPTLGRLGIAQESFPLASVPKLHARFSDTARRPFFVAIHSGEQKEIERKLLVLALSRAYLVTGG
jgi:hypothetical protein